MRKEEMEKEIKKLDQQIGQYEDDINDLETNKDFAEDEMFALEMKLKDFKKSQTKLDALQKGDEQ